MVGLMTAMMLLVGLVTAVTAVAAEMTVVSEPAGVPGQQRRVAAGRVEYVLVVAARAGWSCAVLPWATRLCSG